MKAKLITLFILIILIAGTKFAFFDYPVSTGKRVGNLTKFSLKGKILKTWEGTIDEGSGDKLTSYFSVSNHKLAEELYAYKGRKVVLYYEEYLVGWPRDTKYDVIRWEPQVEEQKVEKTVTTQESFKVSTDPVSVFVGKTLFCSFLGTLINDKDLYLKVKDYIKQNNLYLYNQYELCNK